VEDDEINDPNFGNISEITRRAQIQAFALTMESCIPYFSSRVS
jgi:hypothetical protein